MRWLLIVHNKPRVASLMFGWIMAVAMGCIGVTGNTGGSPPQGTLLSGVVVQYPATDVAQRRPMVEVHPPNSDQPEYCDVFAPGEAPPLGTPATVDLTDEYCDLRPDPLPRWAFLLLAAGGVTLVLLVSPAAWIRRPMGRLRRVTRRRLFGRRPSQNLLTEIPTQQLTDRPGRRRCVVEYGPTVFVSRVDGAPITRAERAVLLRCARATCRGLHLVDIENRPVKPHIYDHDDAEPGALGIILHSSLLYRDMTDDEIAEERQTWQDQATVIEEDLDRQYPGRYTLVCRGVLA